jgi:hypothetical protein
MKNRTQQVQIGNALSNKCPRLYFAKYWYICLEICFSITLDIMGSTDVGLWFVGKHFTPEI